jgi:hypothetical protein
MAVVAAHLLHQIGDLRQVLGENLVVLMAQALEEVINSIDALEGLWFVGRTNQLINGCLKLGKVEFYDFGDFTQGVATDNRRIGNPHFVQYTGRNGQLLQ